MLSPQRRVRNFQEQKLWNKWPKLISSNKEVYLDFCLSFSLEQIISTPTRKTSKIATLIDDVLINSSKK